MSARILSAAALVATVAQSANVNVHNNCNFQVMATPSHQGSDDAPEYVQPGDTFTRPADGEAWCLKLYGPGTGGQQWASQPTQLEWSVWNSGGKDILSYDLSDIDMGQDTTFLQHGMNLTSADPSCDSSTSTCKPAICKPQGLVDSTTPCQDAYNQPFDVRTLGASPDYDLDMVLCTANEETSGGSADSSSSPASSYAAPASSASSEQAQSPPASETAEAPASYTTSAPLQEGADGSVSNGNVVTQWVQNTQVVTQVVTARNAEPTLEKRSGHPHGHHHGRRHHA